MHDCIQITDSTVNSLSAKCANENVSSCHNDTQSADLTENTFLPLLQQQSIDNMPSDLTTDAPSNLLVNADLNLKTQTRNLVLNVSQSNQNKGFWYKFISPEG